MKIPDEIISVAKNTMLRFGGLQPLVFVQGTKKRVYMHLPFGENFGQRVQIMSVAGMSVAKQGGVGDLKLVIFVCEAWVSPARTPFVMPSQDPDRTEVLAITALEPQSNEQVVQMYSCIRGKDSRILELKAMPMPEDANAEGPLLRAFVNGYQLFKW